MNEISRFAVAAGRLALEHARLKVSPSHAEEMGVVLGACNGPSEMGHMDSVFTSDSFPGHVTSFSNIVANSTAGWVSNALYLKGVNASLSAGPHAGLQSLAYAYDALVENRARPFSPAPPTKSMGRPFTTTTRLGFCMRATRRLTTGCGPTRRSARCWAKARPCWCLETASSAVDAALHPRRDARLRHGHGRRGFRGAEPGHGRLRHAVDLALRRAKVSPDHIGLLVWAPQGNRQDLKVLRVCEDLFGDHFARLPLVTTTLNTGYIEAASILVSLAAALAALDQRRRTLASAHRFGGTGWAQAGGAAGTYAGAGRHRFRL